MNSELFNISKEQVMKILRSFLHAVMMGAIGSIIAWMASTLPGLLQQIITNPFWLALAIGLDNAIVKALSEFISDEEGRLGGVI